jgi:hypothetical protein
MQSRGLSVPDIEVAFKEESGRLPLWRTAVSELGARLVGGLLQFTFDGVCAARCNSAGGLGGAWGLSPSGDKSLGVLAEMADQTRPMSE